MQTIANVEKTRSQVGWMMKGAGPAHIYSEKCRPCCQAALVVYGNFPPSPPSSKRTSSSCHRWSAGWSSRCLRPVVEPSNRRTAVSGHGCSGALSSSRAPTDGRRMHHWATGSLPSTTNPAPLLLDWRARGLYRITCNRDMPVYSTRTVK